MTPQDQLTAADSRSRNGDVVALVPRINIHAFCSNPGTRRPCRLLPVIAGWPGPISTSSSGA